MVRGFIMFFLGLSIQTAFGQGFNGQSFLLTDRLLDDCNVEARCDCCASNLVFVSDTQFVLQDYCVDHGVYYTGTYQLTKGRLLLKFKQIKVVDSVDYGTNQFVDKKESCKCSSLEFEVRKCTDGGIILDNLKKPEYRYGTRGQSEYEIKTLAELKASKAFKLLISE